MATKTMVITNAMGVYADVQYSDVSPFPVSIVNYENLGTRSAVFTVTFPGKAPITAVLPPGTLLTHRDVSSMGLNMIQNASAASGFELPMDVSVSIT